MTKMTVDDVNEYRAQEAKVYDLRRSKSAKEAALRELRAMERGFGIKGNSYNGG